MAKNTNSESGDDADLDASEDHSLEMLGRVYSEAVTRRATESGEASLPALTGDPLPSEADAPADSAIDPFSDDACPVNPRTILEAMFFVGVQGSGLTARKAASLIRGVSPKEIEQLVDESPLDELERIGYKGAAPVGGRALDSYFELVRSRIANAAGWKLEPEMAWMRPRNAL